MNQRDHSEWDKHNGMKRRKPARIHREVAEFKVPGIIGMNLPERTANHWEAGKVQRELRQSRETRLKRGRVLPFKQYGKYGNKTTIKELVSVYFSSLL